jgi:hypothetical protein
MEYTNNKRILFPREKGSAQPAGHTGLCKKKKKKRKNKEKKREGLLFSALFCLVSFFWGALSKATLDTKSYIMEKERGIMQCSDHTYFFSLLTSAAELRSF